jgi:hypothetical protein
MISTVTDKRGEFEYSTESRDMPLGSVDMTYWRKCRRCLEPNLDFARGLCMRCYAREVRAERRFKIIVCQHCGKHFTVARADARYCSPRCRQRDHRAQKRP